MAKRFFLTVAAGLAALALGATAASAQTDSVFLEQDLAFGDSGSTTQTADVPKGYFNVIRGTFDNPLTGNVGDFDFDVYKLCNNRGVAARFDAFTVQVPGGIQDPQLWVFDANGRGLLTDDDSGSLFQADLGGEGGSFDFPGNPGSANLNIPRSTVFYLAIGPSRFFGGGPVDGNNLAIFGGGQNGGSGVGGTATNGNPFVGFNNPAALLGGFGNAQYELRLNEYDWTTCGS